MPIIAGEALAWLRAHLTGNGDAPGPTPVRVHVGETGGKGQWRDLADWPPPDAIAQSWHLHAGGTLADSPGEGTSSFRYDPHDPTPSVGGPRMDSNGFGSKDNGKLEARDDVLVFTGPVISEPQEVIGPVSLRLRVRGSSPNFDVFARLCDVDAKGTSWNICDGLLRLDAHAASRRGRLDRDRGSDERDRPPLRTRPPPPRPGVRRCPPPLGPQHRHLRADRDGH